MPRHVAAALVAVALAGAPASAHAGFFAGGASVDITPRTAGAADPNGFGANPLCVAENALSAARVWSDDEPYVDIARRGQYAFGDVYCDANGNLRHDQIYTSGATIGSPKAATSVHDPLQARAFAISDGARTDVVVSVAVQGLFRQYTDQMAAMGRQLARQMGTRVDDVIVSANHNESSPDTLGIYGGPSPSTPDLPGIGALSSPAGLQSGIDDYYMSFLDARVAQVIAAAAASLRPATLYARQLPMPVQEAESCASAGVARGAIPGLCVQLSDNWPTTGHDSHGHSYAAAIDPKVGVLQARDGAARTIFTVMSLAAHNQEVGHSGTSALSSDWPGYFEDALDRKLGGESIFLVADNGSEEDATTVPAVDPRQGTFAQANATGQAWAALIAAQARSAQRLRFGPLRFASRDECVPLENNLFRAAAVVGLFGPRPSYLGPGCNKLAPPALPGGLEGPPAAIPDHLLSSVGVLDVGPDLQLIANPGEAFPALMLGGPWGYEDVPRECNGRPNPGVPVWRSHALFRFPVGLANDMIGYQIPAWAYIGSPGTITSTAPLSGPGSGLSCQTGTPSNPSASVDSAGHQHKLETEGAGPTASNMVADGLTQLVAADASDPSARVGPGRFVLPGGGYARSALGAAGILLAPAPQRGLDPAGGTLIGAPGVAGFGARAVDATGYFMDYDGQPQVAADLSTRGMVVFDPSGCVESRYYLDVFPALDGSHPLGARRDQPLAPPAVNCPAAGLAGAGGVPGVQESVFAALASAFGGSEAVSVQTAAERACLAGLTLRSRILAPRRPRGGRAVVLSGGRLVLRGLTTTGRCRSRGSRIARITVSILRAQRRRCRFVAAGGRLGRLGSCARPTLLLARGRTRWALALRLHHLARGVYRVTVRAVDRSGRREHVSASDRIALSIT
ncbi:MAG: hypothetical protein ACR2HD_02195 [Solirubrobacteraceae bacterium]|nr:MAG: hypothetical protein DLM63_04135 [Solirubrobacterales bacterium]